MSNFGRGRPSARIAAHDEVMNTHLTQRWRDSLRVPPCDDCDHEQCMARTVLTRRLKAVEG